MSHVPPSSMWRSRTPDNILCGQWKVTGRFPVCFQGDVWLDCVRVSYFGRSSGTIVRHYVITEFIRLFVMVGPEHLLPKPDLAEANP